MLAVVPNTPNTIPWLHDLLEWLLTGLFIVVAAAVPTLLGYYLPKIHRQAKKNAEQTKTPNGKTAGSLLYELDEKVDRLAEAMRESQEDRRELHKEVAAVAVMVGLRSRDEKTRWDDDK